jgi:hypothetical protein
LLFDKNVKSFTCSLSLLAPQGINPTIKVWELDQSPGNESNAGGTILAEFSGHKYAVNCVVSEIFNFKRRQKLMR